MSSIACCEINAKFDTPNLHDMCPNPKCKGQKQITSTTRQYLLKGAGFKNKLQKLFKATHTTWNLSIKPGLQIATPSILSPVAAKNKNP